MKSQQMIFYVRAEQLILCVVKLKIYLLHYVNIVSYAAHKTTRCIRRVSRIGIGGH